jgi:chorismate mutase/prephenate dehydratase
MKSLKKLRTRIDRLDQSLLALLNQRGELVQAIGSLKAKNGASVFAPGREREVLHGLQEKNRGPLTDDAIESVFREIVHACRSLQKELSVAYFGPEATFTHQAALRSFGRRAKLVPCRSIPDVFSDVEKGRADYGVVPIENSTEGVVNHTLDMFMESELSICAELELPIQHCLLGKASKLSSARTLISFPQALAQCRHWIETHLPEARVVEASSTAEAARLAAKTAGSVAIASRLAADLYGLHVLAAGIEDASHNFTRFLVIGSVCPEPTGRDKTSIMFSIKDRVGALYEMLLPFKKFRLNLTKIESRPTRQRAWEYIFFVDFLGHRSEKRVLRALALLERSCAFLKILGSYPRTE